MGQNICSKCSRDNNEAHHFCTHCGTSLIEVVNYGPRLIILYGENSEVVFPLKEEYVSIGRDQENNIVLSDEKISKSHAAIVRRDNAFFIEDLQSRNGVFINGSRVEHQQELICGSLIKLGFTFLKFRKN